ncbi:MAG TPA: hypothetical protein VGF69_20415 [Thermoanaerobaculia bacterium]|jgi:hypothetical protein
MTNDERAPKSATTACRERRHPQSGQAAGPAWVRPLRRAQRALDRSARLMASGVTVAARSERAAQWRPIRSSQNLEHAETRLSMAASRLGQVAKELAEITACLEREPETGAGAPEQFMAIMQRWMVMSLSLGQVSSTVFALHENMLAGLASGELVAERVPGSPLRILLTPRPAPIRVSLSVRLSRAADRISIALKRRRRANRPAAVSVPRRASQGRAPPLSLCLL